MGGVIVIGLAIVCITIYNVVDRVLEHKLDMKELEDEKGD